ncbi:Uncharacterized protein dnm_011620 [Desulfonema magnum]|uniref:Uncharacterized protein n=1 Tax=Desulfonema magnum TaxID=45655 RepID=A0A975BGT9_9BACT|nr:Uncharacterized protein dnm_011620 [Desulfonema magnum]
MFNRTGRKVYEFYKKNSDRKGGYEKISFHLSENLISFVCPRVAKIYARPLSP